MSNTPNSHFAGVAGYFTPGDGNRHAIVATHEGRLVGFYTPDDGYQHLIVALPDGFIEEVFFQPNDIHFASPICRLGGIVGIDAFYSDDDRYRHEAFFFVSDLAIDEVAADQACCGHR
jgi:hypothetical protein